MENNDSNLKPQPTGGLKLMTVFIAVLALHVVVIGSITVYHLMSGGSTDADLLTDKTHKDAKSPDSVAINDSSLPQAASADKSATTSAASTDVASASNPPAVLTPSPDQNSSTGPATPAPPPTPAVATAPTTPAPSVPAQSEMATTPVDIAPAPAPSAPVASGPVTMPVVEPQPVSSQPAPEPVASAPYVVKAHDSLARIAHQNHTTVAKLKAANDLKTDVLQIGQKLVLPSGTQVASTTGTTGKSDASLNPAVLSDPPTGPIMGASTAVKTKSTTAGITSKASPKATALADLQHHVYTVVKGDTLTRIAHKFKTSPTAIMTANNIIDPAKLTIGKKLKIPSREARSAKISEPAPVQPSPAKETAPTAQLANFVPQG